MKINQKLKILIIMLHEFFRLPITGRNDTSMSRYV